MASIINASLSSGLVQQADTSGILQLQSNGTTMATVNSAGFYVPGSVVQVVSGTYSTQSSTTSTSPVSTGITVSITPKFNTSKILICITIPAFNNILGTNDYFSLTRGGSAIQNISYFQSGTGTWGGTVGLTYLDSPATTSATTYAITATAATGSTMFWSFGGFISTITALEIAQ